jgi:hypothetical protein
VYLGADVSLDMAELPGDKRFWQLGLGAEVGTRYLELHGRYHLPLDDGVEDVVKSQQTYDASSSQSLGGGARLVTQGTITVRSTLTLLTESMPGWEVEAAALVPGLDKWMDVELVAGYASYHSATVDSLELDSWRYGVEARPVPAVVLAATYFSNERIVGDHWMFSLGMELPFETADIGDGKGGFWGHIRDAFKLRRRHLSERLMEPVRKHSLPLQFNTVPTKLNTQVTAHLRSAIILADGRVVSVKGYDGTSSYSSGSMYNLIDWSSLVGAGSGSPGDGLDLPVLGGGLLYTTYRSQGILAVGTGSKTSISATVAALTYGAIVLSGTTTITSVTGGSLVLVGPNGENIYATADFLASADGQAFTASYMAQGYTAPVTTGTETPSVP